ncbi:MAG: putative toxin-antitoxin system toxin component, PIN family [Nitrospirae bacterium]|nr:putative toxin-antitoxin system toxin component, PIN family [Nitrospirota bacterium]
MRIVLDTNVIIAAFASRGLCADVFEVCVSSHTVVLSEYILAEVADKLAGKLRMTKENADKIVTYLHDIAEITPPVPVEASECRDPDDLPVIGTAIGGMAELLITGDSDILEIGSYNGIETMTPRQLWERLTLAGGSIA